MDEISELSAQVRALTVRSDEDHRDIKDIKDAVMRIELSLAAARGGAMVAKIFYGGIVTVGAAILSFAATHLFKK